MSLHHVPTSIKGSWPAILRRIRDALCIAGKDLIVLVPMQNSDRLRPKYLRIALLGRYLTGR